MLAPFFEGAESGLASTQLKLTEDVPRTGFQRAFAGVLAAVVAVDESATGFIGIGWALAFDLANCIHAEV